MTMTTLQLLLLLIALPIALLLISYFLLVVITVILAEWTRLRGNYKDAKSALFVGRVSHSRQLPAKHSFAYPIFMTCVDLSDDDDDFNTNVLWPLSYVMSLRDGDHYKNNEGRGGDTDTTTSLAQRTLNLVTEKTENKFQPTLQTHSVKLLTHLCYYGYCFNPVSFYYLQNRQTLKTDALVAEVSNTPWNEMQCYVLHPESVDMKDVKKGRTKKETIGSVNYIFQKTFHVSPFMDMDHLYDWTFWDYPTPANPLLCVSTSMVKADQLYFNAYLELQNRGLHPYTVSRQLLKFPIFCFIIQLWIHYEAAFLLIKGVSYVPHPNDSETAASRIIGTMAIPLFVVKDWFDARFGGGGGKEKAS